MNNPELIALVSALVSVAASFTAGLFAFLNAWSKQKYDADRIRLEAKVDELTRDNADLKSQLADERKTCDERIKRLELQVDALIRPSASQCSPTR